MDTVVNLIFKTVGGNKLDAVDKKLKGIGPSATKAANGINSVSKAVQGLGRALAVAAIGDQLRRAFGAAADFSATQQRVQNLTETYKQYIGIQDLAAQSANQFGISNAQALKDLADLGSRLGGTGATLKDLEDAYQGFNTLIVNNAVGTQQAAAAQLQLNQALGSGRLAGEEFNAINEATPQLLDAVAKVMGVARGELKQLAADGEISSSVLLKALRKVKEDGADQLAESFETPAGKLRLFEKSVEDLQVVIGTKLLPVFTPLVEGVTGIANGFAKLPGPIQTVIGGFVALTAAVTALNFALGTLTGTGIVGAFKAIGAAATALVANLSVVGAQTAALAAGKTALANAITAANTKITLMNVSLGATKVAMLALPWVAALAGVVALGKAFYDYFKLREKNADLKEDTEKTLREAYALRDKRLEAEKMQEAAEKIAEAQKNQADEALRAAKAFERQMVAKQKLYEVETNLQKTLLDIEMQKAQLGLDNAKNMDQVIAAANQIYKVTVEQAKLDKEIAIAKIKAAVNELKAKSKILEATLNQAKAERAILVAQGEKTDKIDASINKVKTEIAQNQELVGQQEKIAELQTKQTQAIYEQTLRTAELTKEKNIQEGKERLSNKLNEAKSGVLRQQTGEMQKQTGEISKQNAALKEQKALLDLNKKTIETVQGVSRSDLPKSISDKIIDSGSNFIGVQAATRESNRLREESRKAAEGLKTFTDQLENTDKSYQQIMADVKRQSGSSAGYITQYAQEMYNKTRNLASATDNAIKTIDNSANSISRSTSTRTSSSSTSRGYYVESTGSTGTSSNPRYLAGGGYVNTPTRAMIGEGGEGEYIVPESKMYEAMQRFGRGQRGESVVPSSASVNVNWNGEMIQMDGKAYVEKSQVPGLIQTAVSETMNTLHRNAKARAFVGV